MRKSIIFLLLFVFSGIGIFAKTTSGECPPWVKGEMPPKSNDSYYFMTAEGTGLTIGDARNDADLVLVGSLMRSAGVTVSGSQVENILHKASGNKVDEIVLSNYQYNFEIDSIRIAFMPVDSYWEKRGNTYECKVLYEVAENPSSVVYDPVEYTSKYGARGLWRSAIVPGWGQMYKNSYGKGVAILVVEAAAITTACVFNNQHSSYINKSKATTDPEAIRFYQNKANNARNLSNAFFIGAGAVYIYNLVDAVVAKGKLRYVDPKGRNLSFSPYLSPDANLGLSIAYCF